MFTAEELNNLFELMMDARRTLREGYDIEPLINRFANFGKMVLGGGTVAVLTKEEAAALLKTRARELKKKAAQGPEAAVLAQPKAP